MPTKHVIIGAGPAGINAIETIRQYDGHAGEVHLICDEPPYSRMALPYFLAGTVPEKHIMTGSKDYFAQLGVTPHFKQRVSRIDPAAHMVMCQDGDEMQFDRLLIATGSSALRPPIPGSKLPGVYNLWTLKDARAVVKKAKKGTHVLFVGAGFIGFIVLNAMAKLGCTLTVVELEGQVLPRMLDIVGGRLVGDWLSEHGVHVLTATGVENISRKAKKLTARLSNGQSISADLVIMAIGIRPNIEFLQGSGIDIEQGILVNQRCQTNFPDIFAAGDCAQGPDLSTGRPIVHAIQPTAVDHGRVAGANMAGREVNYQGSLLINIVDVMGLQCASFGQWRKETADTVSAVNHTRPTYRKILWDGDRMAGAILLGPTSDVSTLNDLGMIKGFIQSRAPLGPWKNYIQQTPMALRRAYLGAGIGIKLAATTLLPAPSIARHYRFQHAPFATEPGEYHAQLAAAFATAQPPTPEPTE